MDLERPSTSALVRRLREAARAKERSIGFARERETEPSPAAVVLLAEVGGLDPAAAGRAVAAGAASVLFAVDAEAASRLARDGGAAKTAIDACGKAVAGVAVVAEAWTLSGLADGLARAGFDYVVADVDGAPAWLLTTEGLACVARVEETAQTTGLLRALGDLQIDAILAGRTKPALAATGLSLLDLMSYRHVIECVRQPVMIAADASVEPEDIQALRDLGVVGIMVPGANADRLAAFGGAIANVKAGRVAGTGGPAVVLPRVAIGQGREAEEEEEDDESLAPPRISS
ncbi:MAG TPA: hypothetical protein VG370_25865 [Chloroflexota bacterium]|jgi:hypothetical protein|nr:hypothetical protein [Chloroflexota bacterium]